LNKYWTKETLTMLTLLIPNEISAAARAGQLTKAKASRRRHEIIMRHTRKRCDLRAFAHAKRMFDLASETVRAWEAVCRAGCPNAVKAGAENGQIPGEAA
jgi:hypothetical protein